MRSQATKPLPKKGALSKTTLKASSATKQAKKKVVSPKKVKTLVKKSIVKSPKKNSSKDDVTKSDGESSGDDKCDLSPEISKGGPSRGNTSRSESPTKKSKKEPREKKDAVKSTSEINVKKIVSRKNVKSAKKTTITGKSNSMDSDSDSDDVKYKINLNAVKKATSKLSKAKTVIKKGNINLKKKNTPQKKQETRGKDDTGDIKNIKDVLNETNDEQRKVAEQKSEESKKDIIDITDDKKEDPKPGENVERKISTDVSNIPSNISVTNQSETPKSEIERPPKFFTSSRSPRTVDIDVKCCKNSKGNLSVSERFLSLKCDDNNKDKNASNTLVSQGPEIDVYTFTEKVDSPKSILSDFRSPINKNIGRVRPIARVKGTVIDRKTDTEKKKFSPHRPIEEVVKQLKAIKRSEELNTNDFQDATSSVDSSITSSEKDVEDKPIPIVSKSYKMVARKSSITGKPFSPIKFLDQEPSVSKNEKVTTAKKKQSPAKSKKQQKKSSLSDDELDSCKFSLNTKTFHYTSSEDSVSESNDDNDTKESSESDTSKNKKAKIKKYKRITDSAKKTTSKELKELSKDSLIDLKEDSIMLGNEKPSKRRLKLLSMWSGPKKHRMASLNAIAKVHCLYENESRTHMELGLMRTIDRQIAPSTSKSSPLKKKETKQKTSEKLESNTSGSEYENRKDKKDSSSESSDDNPPQRTLRGVPGIRSAGKYWDPKSSTSSSEDSEIEYKKQTSTDKKKTSSKVSSGKSDTEKPPAKMKKTAGVPVKKKRNRNEVVMDLKDMVVQKRMASLNATAILAASYEKRSPKSNKDETTSDSCSDESFSQKSKNGVSSGVKSEVKCEDTKTECDDNADRKQKVEVIVNQDTDVTITGMYSTHHHEGFCTVSGMQYRISSTSHTQTTATANCEKEDCSREDGSRYTPLSALSSMQPPAEHPHPHPHPVPELGGLTRRAAGCSSAFSAPSPSAHHEPGYYQPAGPLIKETSADAERALARYHPPPHYHAPHPPVLQQYGPPYYPADLCYGRYYRPPGPYHMAPQPDAQMVGVGSEPYPPPQYYGTPPCYQHSPQRIPYVEYRGCPCPLNACPKNVHIGPATGKAPTGGGPAEVISALAPPGGAFRTKVRACALDAGADSHGSGKDPPLEQEPAAADAPHPCPLPAIGGASPKREIFDVRDNMRLAGDTPGPAEAIGSPSPARGSAGACAPQPPPVAPRRARLGKAMARRSLAGDDTALLLSAPHPLPLHHSDVDDDVMAISPPVCAPIDLSSSDERSTPLVDVKKENEGPTYASSRKTDAQALREHNCTTALSDTIENIDTAKTVKRKYSRPKLEIDMIDIQLEDVCKTNGIGEHVKLQKRRKVSCEQTAVTRTETITKEPKKKAAQQTKRTPKTPTSEKKTVKRKLEMTSNSPKAKKMLLESSVEDPRLKNVAALPEEPTTMKPKNKSALLLDNLIRKNSIDRNDAKGINPAELFLSPNESTTQNCSKKTLNINNNIVENSTPISGVRPNTIAAVSQLIEKKLAYKNACKVEKVDSKVTHNLKSVLNTPNDEVKLSEDPKLSSTKCKMFNAKNSANISVDKSNTNSIEVSKDKCESIKDKCNDHVNSINKNVSTVEEAINETKLAEESHSISNNISDKLESELKDQMKEVTEVNSSDINKSDKTKRYKLGVNKPNGHMKNKSIEKVAKLLVSKKPAIITEEVSLVTEKVNLTKENADKPLEKILTKRFSLGVNSTNDESKGKSIEKVAKFLVSKKPMPKSDDISADIKERDRTKQTSDPTIDEILEQTKPEKAVVKRCKLSNGEIKAKNVEKVVKLLVSKKPAIKTDEATLVIEDACGSPIPSVGRRTRRRRSGGMRRTRRFLPPLAPPLLEPRAPPRWSNGWNWDGENYVSKVYLNNDSRLDRTARCWPRMTHASGDSVGRGDCVLLRASTARAQPFVARVASLWENPDDGEMMVSLVWYYRPEHTERGREPSDAPDEVFASRHRDANSVACIEDKCYVLTFNEYCRYRKRLKAAEEGVTITPTIVPPLPASEITSAVAPNDSKLPPSVSPELVLFCRKIYDFRSKKIQVPNK